MNIKTNFWKEKNWQPKIEKLMYLIGLTLLPKILIETITKQNILLILDISTFTIITIIIISHNKWKKNKK